jgi:hypothetical protein
VIPSAVLDEAPMPLVVYAEFALKRGHGLQPTLPTLMLWALPAADSASNSGR